MDEKSEKNIEKFYNKLKNTIIRDKKLHRNSVFLTLVQTTKNKSRVYLNDSSLNLSRLLDIDINKLESENYIRQTDTLNEYVITAKGVWFIENKLGVLSEDIIITYFDKRSYDFFGNVESLNDRDKVIIFSMIAARTFSRDSVVDLTNDRSKELWKEIVEDVHKFLGDSNFIKKESKNGILGDAKADYPIVNLFRHSDFLPMKTKSIFTSIGSLKYYLNLSDNENEFQNDLAFLFWLIFEEKEPSLAKITTINDFLKDVSSDKGIYLFDIDGDHFSGVEYDMVIRESLKKSQVMKRRWERGLK